MKLHGSTVSQERVEKFFVFLDERHGSGFTNMYAAVAYVMREFSLGAAEAEIVTQAWRKTFNGDPVAQRAAAALVGKEG